MADASTMPRFDDLPTEILAEVCEILDQRCYASSLLAFARASQKCYSVASSVLCRTISFTVEEARVEEFAKEVQNCRDTLRRDRNLGRVRRVFVDGELLSDQPSYLYRGRSAGRRHFLPEGRWNEYDETSISGYLDEATSFDLRTDQFPPERVHTIDADFQPLADLLPDLTGLTSFIWSCTNQFPLCLLRAINRHLPNCKLRSNTFSLRSAAEVAPEPYELILAMSPCLSAIRCALPSGRDYVGRGPYTHLFAHGTHGNSGRANSDRTFDYNGATMRLMSNLAPNLEEVRMWYPYSDRVKPLKDRPWKNLRTDWSGSACPTGRLKHLQIISRDRHSISRQPIEDWSKFTQFSVLRVLKLRGPLASDAVEFLSICDLSNLVNLFVILGDNERDAYYNDAKQFFQGLYQLRTLALHGWNRRVTLSSILLPNLRTLEIWHRDVAAECAVSTAGIEEIARKCPLLESLSLKILRSKGDADEVAAYKALGAIPNLRRLTIWLDVPAPPTRWGDVEETGSGSDVQSDGETFWELDDEQTDIDTELPERLGDYEQDQVKDLFINIAVGETLVRAIYGVIAVTRRSLGFQPLLGLETHVQNWGKLEFMHGTDNIMRAYEEVMACSWSIKRDQSFNRFGELIVQEICRPVAWQEGTWLRSHKLTESIKVERGGLHRMFREIWPPKNGREEIHSWRGDWQSFPLSLEM